MKALVLTGPKRVELQSLSLPQPGPGQIRVHHRVTAISTGSEVIRYLNGGGPHIGYLGAGVVDAVGEGVSRFHPGDRVKTFGPHHEYTVLRAEEAQPMPDGLDYDQAAYAYLPTLALHALRLCDYRLGEHVSIIGQGVIGLMGAALCEAMGVPILALDVDESRLAVARALGIRHPLNPSHPDFARQVQAIVGDKGVDISVDATGSYHGLVQALELTRTWGRVAILGMYRPDPPSPEMAARLHQAYLKNLHAKELRLVGCSNDPREAYPSHIWRFSIYDNIRLSLDLLGQGRYRLTPAITHRFAPEDGPTLYERLGRREPGMLGVVYDWSAD